MIQSEINRITTTPTTMRSLFVKRRGLSSTSFMKTNFLVRTFQPNCLLKMVDGNLWDFQGEMGEGHIIQHEPVKFVMKSSMYLNIQNTWDIEQRPNENDPHANILGGCGRLYVNEIDSVLPIVDATCENVEYYGCHLYRTYDIFQFKSNYEMPFFNMSIGPTYVRDYILQPKLGGGVYLEYHSAPHVHMPLQESESGFVVVGKFTGDRIHLTGFKIPYDSVLYMPPYTIHNDCFCVGDWNVAYKAGPSIDFSTVLLRMKPHIATQYTFEKMPTFVPVSVRE